MQNNDNKKEKPSIKPEIKNDQGLNLSYDKTELERKFPNLFSELNNKGNKVVKNAPNPEKRQIKLADDNIEEIIYEENISNPGIFDFLRRCKNSEDALSIVNYMKSRNEITNGLYENLSKIINQKGGLEKLIQDCGGLKKPGYYLDKYYFTQ